MLAAIDIEDTLVGPDKRIGHENCRAVALLGALGCRVVLASGRRNANVLSYCNKLGLDDFVVSSFHLFDDWAALIVSICSSVRQIRARRLSA